MQKNMRYNFKPVHITPDTIIGEPFEDSDERSPSYVTWFLEPIGPKQAMEMSDTIYHKDEIIPYHVHTQNGREVFLVDGGNVECWLNGKKTVVHKGDIVFIPPNTCHGFKYLDNPVLWREYFEDIGMNEGLLVEQRVRVYHPDEFADKDILNKIYSREGTYFYGYTPVLQDADPSEVHEVRQYNKPLHQYEFDGIVMQQRISRYEMDGINEIWQYNVEEGFQFSFDCWNPHVLLLDVFSGSVEVKLDGMGPFVAKERDIIRVPRHVAGTITALEKTELIDYHCGGKLLNAMEEISSIRAYHPEQLQDETAVKKLLEERYDCFVMGKKA